MGVGKDAGGERGVCAYRTLVEEQSMTGPQFLDLVVRRTKIKQTRIRKKQDDNARDSRGGSGGGASGLRAPV